MNNKAKYDIIIEALYKLTKEKLPVESRLALYGSRARGDARRDSDWDLHIVIPGEGEMTIEEISKWANPFEDLGWDFDEYFSTMAYTSEGWKRRSFLPYYKNVEQDKIIIYGN